MRLTGLQGLKAPARAVFAAVLMVFSLVAPTANAATVQPVFDASYIPIAVGEDGVFYQLFQNRTGKRIRTIQIYFRPQLTEDPSIVGAGIAKATVDEVILTGLNIRRWQEFLINIKGLKPNTKFVVANHNERTIDPADASEIAAIDILLSRLNQPAPTPVPVPMPMPLWLLGSGVAMLGGLRQARRLRNFA